MLIDVNKWIDKNGSFDEAGGLDLVRHGYEWIRRMRANLRKIVAYKDFAKQMVMAQYE